MKNLLKWAGIIVGILLLVLIIGTVALPIFLPLEKIKEFAVAKISETINREVKIEKVSFNLFSGIKPIPSLWRIRPLLRKGRSREFDTV